MPSRPAQRQPRLHNPAEILGQAARRWQVPVWALVGVKLSETGSDPHASNPFQFEPGTARSYGVDTNSLASSANGAAHLLHDYYGRYHNWDSVFEAYNGGPGAVGKGYAYNTAHVRSKLAEFGVAGKSDAAMLGLFGGKANLGSVPQGTASPSSSPASPSSGPSGLGGELLHIGLVGALVLGGATMIGLGTTRMLGSARAAK
jgi:hypothetical protein